MLRFSSFVADDLFFKETFKALKEIFQRLYQFPVAKRVDESGPPNNGEGDLAFQILFFSVIINCTQQRVAEIRRGITERIFQTLRDKLRGGTEAVAGKVIIYGKAG